jgi:DNA-binding beta-propeller fold protein YncE
MKQPDRAFTNTDIAMFRSDNNGVADACGLPTAILALLLLTNCLLTACALESGINEPPPSAGIDVTLTTINEFVGATAPLNAAGEPQQLGYAAAVAAASGYIFVIDSSVAGLVRLDAARGESRLLHGLDDANTAGLYVTTDLLIYVVDRPNRAVLELSDSGWERRRFSDTKMIPAPVDVTRTNWGATVLIADELTQRLVMFDSLTGPTGSFNSTLSPVAVAASITAIAATDDSVFVLDAASREVTQLDLYGRVAGTYGDDALLAPVAMAVDACQRVFVADGHPDGLLVTSSDSYGMSSRAALPREITPAVTDLWIDGNLLYVAAGAFGLHVLSIEPACMGQ